ncbi:MAG: alpha/beta hydrolase, partial [Bacteroidota bacterium]
MNWQSFHIDLPMARIAAIEAGDGPNVLLCLHGYEQRKDLFKPLFEPLLEGWRFVAIDLPLYGETEWFERDRPLDEAFLEALWSGFAERYAGSRLHLLGFSMGGKVALSLQSSVRRRAESLILLAPDSDQSNFWHWLIRTPLGLHLNAWLDRNPQWVLRPASWLFKIGLLDKLSYK